MYAYISVVSRDDILEDSPRRHTQQIYHATHAVNRQQVVSPDLRKHYHCRALRVMMYVLMYDVRLDV